MLEAVVCIEELKALVAVKFVKEVGEMVASTEDVIELIVAEADAAIVRDGTAIVYFVDVGPEDGAEAHMARLTRGV